MRKEGEVVVVEEEEEEWGDREVDPLSRRVHGTSAKPLHPSLGWADKSPVCIFKDGCLGSLSASFWDLHLMDAKTKREQVQREDYCCCTHTATF